MRTVLTRLLSVALVFVLGGVARGEEQSTRTGFITFTPTAAEESVPKQFHLAAHRFEFHQTRPSEVAGRILLSRVTFASPVTTPHELNNTVHCEYFRPTKVDHAAPGVVVLHILGGDFPLSRLFCTALAMRGTPALFVKMPYYGPRRDPKVKIRMISRDPRQTVRGMTQAVLDIRRAAAWLAAQEEVDEQQLGVFGISLGGITAALAAAGEPRFVKVCPVLAGGDIAQIAWESPEMKNVRKSWEAQGGTRDSLVALMKTIDPVTYAPRVRGRNILMLNARQDEVIPHRCTQSLWKAFGEPRIEWYDAGHYSAIKYLGQTLVTVTDFFQPDEKPNE